MDTIVEAEAQPSPNTEERACRVVDLGGGTAYLHCGPYDEYKNILRAASIHDEYLMVRMLNEVKNCYAWNPYAQQRLNEKRIRIRVTFQDGRTDIIE